MSKKDVTMPLREFPQSLSAEAAVLDSIIIDPSCFAEVAKLLCVDAFGYYENRAIYEALLRISNRGDGRAIDDVLLRDELVTLRELRDGRLLMISSIGAGMRFYNGKIDHVGIYNIALVAGQIEELAN